MDMEATCDHAYEEWEPSEIGGTQKFVCKCCGRERYHHEDSHG